MPINEKDKHVLAAAVRGGADLIVTLNLKDFPTEPLVDYQVAAISPDIFLDVTTTSRGKRSQLRQWSSKS